MSAGLLSPPAEFALRRRMHFVLVAEQLRLARRVLAAAGELLEPGRPAERPDYALRVKRLGADVQVMGAAVAEQVGADYAALFGAPLAGYSRDEAGGRFAQLLHALLLADRAELEALAADATCVYRAQAARVLELLRSFGEPNSERLESVSQLPGVCRACRCTDLRACVPACWWVDAARTLCSACAYREDLEESIEVLLDGVPAEGGHVSRDSLESLIREGFGSGALAALQCEQADGQALDRGGKTVMKSPHTPTEWQAAVDAAEACLCLDAARQYGLVTGGAVVNVARAVDLLRAGKVRGFEPAPDAIERFIAEEMRS